MSASLIGKLKSRNILMRSILAFQCSKDCVDSAILVSWLRALAVSWISWFRALAVSWASHDFSTISWSNFSLPVSGSFASASLSCTYAFVFTASVLPARRELISVVSVVSFFFRLPWIHLGATSLDSCQTTSCNSFSISVRDLLYFEVSYSLIWESATPSSSDGSHCISLLFSKLLL